MNILILTPIHPVQIAEMINFLAPYYTDKNNIFSIQAMGLLGEELFKDDKKHYLPLTFSYTAEVRKRPELCFTKDRQFNIFYGNLDRNTNIKFDHILAFSSMDNKEGDERFDGYLEKGNKIYGEVFDNLNVERIQWYTIEDAHHRFPTLRHLAVMLKTLGVEKNVDDSVQ